MTPTEIAKSLWRDMHAQNWQALAAYFTPDATIYWHNTNEQFTPAEFVRANSEYPGEWHIAVERAEQAGANTAITAARVTLAGGGESFYATSFFTIENGKIHTLHEYWGDVGPAPAWRRQMDIGRPIKGEV